MSYSAKNLMHHSAEPDRLPDTPASSPLSLNSLVSPMASRQGAVMPDSSDATLFSDIDTDSTAPLAAAATTQWPDFGALPSWLRQELRSDHAGEYGAVMIYRGVLSVSKDASVREFAERHLLTEQQHLSLMEEIVPRHERTKLLPLWWMMGWLTGALPSLFGRQVVFATIEAVETFVDHHYEQQIQRLAVGGNLAALRETLVTCQADEVSHRDEAARLALPRRSLFLRLWCKAVGSGSALAVIAAKRI